MGLFDESPETITRTHSLDVAHERLVAFDPALGRDCAVLAARFNGDGLRWSFVAPLFGLTEAIESYVDRSGPAADVRATLAELDDLLAVPREEALRLIRERMH